MLAARPGMGGGLAHLTGGQRAREDGREAVGGVLALRAAWLARSGICRAAQSAAAARRAATDIGRLERGRAQIKAGQVR